MKKISKIVIMLFLLFSLVFLANPSTVEAAETGLTFEEYNRYVVNKPFEDLPYTVEAEVKLPSGLSGNAGSIFGNMDWAIWSYSNGSPRTWLLDVYNGNVRLYYTYKDDNRAEITFSDVNVCTGEWLHLAVSIDVANSKTYLYVNGELKSTKAISGDMSNLIKTTRFHIGGDNRTLNPRYFKGAMRELNVYSDLRTAAEIKASYTNGVDLTDSNLIAQYNMSSSNVHKNITDNSGNGYWGRYEDSWYDSQEISLDYTHSFAVVGDTQMLNHWGMSEDGTNTKDATTITNNMNNLYKWIVDNKDANRIEHVFGLGDITETWGKQEGSAALAEWQRAKDAIYQMNGEVSYSIIRGNHDESIYMNRYFGEQDTLYRDQFEGFYGDTINSSYKTIKVGNIDYLFVTLDYGASDAELAWANEVVARYPNHKVVVTTHGYLEQEGNRMENYPHTPCDGSDVDSDADYNNAEQIWEKFVSNHPNIFLVMGGHVCDEDITYNQSIGKHGNVVTEVLIDFQDLDKSLVSEKKQDAAGMVVMLYLNEDATKFEVAAYSTVRKKYYKTTNHFTVDMTGSCNDKHTIITKKDEYQHWFECESCGLVYGHANHVYVDPQNTDSSKTMIATCECGATKEKSSTNNELALQLQAMLERYYNNGIYIKDTKIYIDPQKVGDDLKNYFHAKVDILDRITYYDKDKLWMSTGVDYSGYGTSSEGYLTSFRVDLSGNMGSETVHPSLPGMEDYYCTLLDFILGEHTSAHSHNESLNLVDGWVYKNGVYSYTLDENNTNEDILDAFRLFTAPVWLEKTALTKNYVSYNKATIEEVDGKLVMRLWVSALDSGFLIDDVEKDSDGNLLFSEAVISEFYWDGDIANSLKGSGTEEDPYLIERASDLAYLEEQSFKGHYYSGKFFKLVNDLDLGDANIIIETFDGTFDGNGKIIKGLAIENTDLNTGLFRLVESKGVIKNLKVYGSVSGKNNVGGIAGILRGKIIGCENHTIVTGNNTVGGIVGYNSGTITECSNEGEVHGYSQVGGIAGNTVGNITKSYNNNLVKGTNTTGGIVGLVTWATVSYCENKGSVEATSWNIGGIAGRSGESSTVTDCTNSGSVYSTSDAVGGICGTAQSKVIDCVNEGTVQGKTSIGGIAGVTSASGALSLCENASSAVVTGTSYVGGISGQIQKGTSVSTSINAGKVKGANTTGGIVGLAEGAGASVANCENKGSVEATSWNIGGIAGRSGSGSTVMDCINSGSVYSTSDAVGGICGTAQSSVIDCLNTGTVQANNNVGGIAGVSSSSGNITGCQVSSSCTINGNTSVGGIVGKITKGNVSDSFNYGTVTGAASTGGIVGLLTEGNLSNVNNYGSVKGAANTGGVIGKKENNAIISTVTNSSNQGPVTPSGWGSGGIVGYAACLTLTDCINTGNVVGTNNQIGGIAGALYSSSKATNCHNYGEIKAADQVGGIAGNLQTNIVNCDNYGKVTATKSGTTLFGPIYGKHEKGTMTGCDDLSNQNLTSHIIVNHLYFDGTNASAPEVTEAVIGEIYTLNAKTISGYAASHDYVKVHFQGGVQVVNIYYSQVDVWDGSSVSTSLSGTGTAADPFLIQSGADLAYLQNYVDSAVKNKQYVTHFTTTSSGVTYDNYNVFTGIYFKLTKSIDLNGNSIRIGYYNAWYQYCAFNGIFDGNNCSIRNLNTESSTLSTGLFDAVGKDGIVKNINVYGTVTSTSTNVGGVAGWSGGTLDNCTNYVSVSGAGTVGGVVGNSEMGSKILNCINYGAINSTGYNTGGVAGQGKSTITNCINFGYVTSSSGNVGGLIGNGDSRDTTSIVSKCINYGTVKGTATHIAGIIGNSYSNVMNCHNYGDIIGGTWGWGGIAGYSSGTISNCTNNGLFTEQTGGQGGGIVGKKEGGSVINCTNNSTIVRTQANYNGNSVAGIVGEDYNSKGVIIKGCINNGDITGYEQVGGIAGTCVGSITNCTNTGTISGVKLFGDILGKGTATLTGNSENLFLGKVFTPTDAANAAIYSDTYGYAKLTDGVYSNSGRFSTKVNNGTNSSLVNATVDFGENCNLSLLKLYAYYEKNKVTENFCGADFKVEAMVDGKWVEVASYTVDTVSQYFIKTGTGAKDNIIILNLGNVVATQVRISSTGATAGSAITFYEIQCYGSISK